MDTVTIISIIAASITTIGFFFIVYKKIKKSFLNLSEKITNIELSINSKQKFILKKIQK